MRRHRHDIHPAVIGVLFLLTIVANIAVLVGTVWLIVVVLRAMGVIA